MRSICHALIGAAVVTLSACGGSSGSSGGADVRTLNTVAGNVSAAASAYATQANGMTDAASCNAAEASYDGQVRPEIVQMQGMGPTMDQMMTGMGKPADADMSCAANAMMAELDRHHAAACASATDMAPNKDEAEHHAHMMNDWADHQQARSYTMGTMMGSGTGGMGMGGMSGSGMMTGHCVRNPDGTYSLE